MGSSRALAGVAFGLTLFAATALADPPRLLLDAAIDLAGAKGSSPRQLVSLGDRVLFVADDEAAVEQLWASDGTLDGTYSLGPSCPGSPYRELWRYVGPAPDAALFSFYCPGEGTSLWRSDGSAAGTFELLDYSAGEAVVPAAPFADGILFEEDTSSTGGGADRLRLWASDGSAAGTRRVVDAALGDYATFSAPVAAADRIELVVWPAGGGVPELWASSGSNATTRRVATLDRSFSYPYALDSVAFGRHVAWRDHGSQIWVSDGTSGGSGPVTSFASPEEALGYVRATPDGDRLLFVADDAAGEEVWETDGTPGGTRRLTDLASPYALQFYSGPRFLVPLGDRVLFFMVEPDGIPRLVAADRITGAVEELARPCANETESWVCRGWLWLEQLGDRAVYPVPIEGLGTLAASDGTPEGTEVLGHLCPAGCAQQPWAPTRVGGELFGLITPVEDELELWSLDAAGILTPRGGGIARFGGSPWSGPLEIARAGDLALFPAADERHGVELFRSIPGVLGLELVEDLAFDAASARIEPGVETGGELYLPVEGRVLRTDGRREGTVELLEPPASSCGSHGGGETADLRPLGDRLLIANGDCEEGNLWSYDPATGELLTLLGTERPDRPDFFRVLAVADGEADLLAGTYGVGATELWGTDGTEAETRALVSLPGEIGTVTRSGELRYLTVDARLYLWRPGDPAATPVAAGPHQWFQPFATAGGLGLFLTGSYASSAMSLIAVAPDGAVENLLSADDGSWFRPGRGLGELHLLHVDRADRAPEVWVTDGRAAGTRKLHASAPTDQLLNVARAFTPIGERVAFFGFSEDGGTELWTTDGTENGTRLLDRLTAGGESTEVMAVAAAGGRVFVVGLPRTEGGPDYRRAWLWTSPDSPGAAALLAQWPLDDAALVALWDWERALGVLDDRVYFAAAAEEASGNELWSSDGSAAGTGRVADLAPGPDSSAPGTFMTAGGRLFFAADDGLTGHELWSYDPADAALCRASTTELCLQAGRFRVEAYWTDFEGVQGEATAVPLTADSGAFWFFDSANVELVTKVLDGTALYGHHWVFYGALSNVRYALTVRDGLTGAAMRYVNPAGTYASVGDSAAFGPLGASATSAPEPVDGVAAGVTAVHEGAGPPSGVCTPGPTRLCLLGNRFEVEVVWRDFEGNFGVGQAVPWAGGESGTFWFFDAANVELIVKVLDGTPINGRYWVYYGALSNVAYELTVTDTLTGAMRTYLNPAGTFASVGDVDAF